MDGSVATPPSPLSLLAIPPPSSSSLTAGLPPSCSCCHLPAVATDDKHRGRLERWRLERSYSLLLPWPTMPHSPSPLSLPSFLPPSLSSLVGRPPLLPSQTTMETEHHHTNGIEGECWWKLPSLISSVVAIATTMPLVVPWRKMKAGWPWASAGS